MKTKALILASALSVVTFTMTGCAPDMSANNYNYANTGAAQATVEGVIVSLRPVHVSGDSTAGTAIGAGGGALAGSLIGGGTRANLAGALGGAVVGGLVGRAAGKSLTGQTAIEYIVKTKSGRLLTIVQGTQTSLAVGQRVLVILGNPARIIPATTY